jgi:acetyl esterase/lipase
MKQLSRVLFLFAFVFSNLGCSNDSYDNNDVVVPDFVEAYQALNVFYGSDLNQSFDLYLPENRTTSTKVIILVHGGSWVGGDKSDMSSIKDYILETHPNVGVVNMNYTLADAVNPPLPMQTVDISAVVDYLSANKSTLIMSDDIGFIGISAGAHLSLLWSYAYDINNQVDMVCSIVGPTNFTDPAYSESTNPLFQSLLFLFGNPSVNF